MGRRRPLLESGFDDEPDGTIGSRCGDARAAAGGDRAARGRRADPVRSGRCRDPLGRSFHSERHRWRFVNRAGGGGHIRAASGKRTNEAAHQPHPEQRESEARGRSHHFCILPGRDWPEALEKRSGARSHDIINDKCSRDGYRCFVPLH
jgi:hypothetical protein